VFIYNIDPIALYNHLQSSGVDTWKQTSQCQQDDGRSAWTRTSCQVCWWRIQCLQFDCGSYRWGKVQWSQTWVPNIGVSTNTSYWFFAYLWTSEGHFKTFYILNPTAELRMVFSSSLLIFLPLNFFPTMITYMSFSCMYLQNLLLFNSYINFVTLILHYICSVLQQTSMYNFVCVQPGAQ
jgi:hypothetical protein